MKNVFLAICLLAALDDPPPICGTKEQDIPLPAFQCPEGQVPEPGCKFACEDNYKFSQYQSIDTYCHALGLVNNRFNSAVSICLEQYDYCVLHSPPDFCLTQVNQCLDQATANWAYWMKRLEDEYHDESTENLQFYLSCMSYCCMEP